MRLVLLALLFLPAAAAAQQTNFQISPPPIPYPYFEPGRTDSKISLTYFSLETETAGSVDIKGGGANLNARKAFSETVAGDLSLGLMGISGTMPGFALPFYYGGDVWRPVIEDDTKLSGVMFPLSANLELQPIGRPGGSLILFVGPTMSMAVLNMATPYHARGMLSNTNAASTEATATATVGMFGFQAGMQAGLKLGAIKLAPFFMVTTQGGSSTFTYKSGYKTANGDAADAQEMEPYSTTSVGMDIIVVPWNLSIGTLVQQAASTDNQEGVTTTLLTVSYHFRGS